MDRNRPFGSFVSPDHIAAARKIGAEDNSAFSAPTLRGIKPSNLFRYQPQNRDKLLEALDFWNRELEPSGLQVRALKECSRTNVREAIFNAIPMTLKSAVSVGIGLFVAFVGLQNAKLIVNSDSTLVTYQHFKGETFHSIGVGAILTLVGVLITAILLVKKVKGGILYGILITWVLGILCEMTGIYIPNPDAGMYSVIPTSFISFDFSALGKTFGQVFKTDFSGVGILNFFAVMFSFLFVDLFDTLGTLIGVASKADMLDEDGKLPHIKGALLADSIATCAGAVLGTSTRAAWFQSFYPPRRGQFF